MAEPGREVSWNALLSPIKLKASHALNPKPRELNPNIGAFIINRLLGPFIL